MFSANGRLLSKSTFDACGPVGLCTCFNGILDCHQLINPFPDFFNGIFGVYNLRLNLSDVSNFPPKLFELIELNSLAITFGNMTSLPKPPSSSSKWIYLETLNFSNNQITKLGRGDFITLSPIIKNIDLSNNPVYMVSAGLLDGLEKKPLSLRTENWLSNCSLTDEWYSLKCSVCAEGLSNDPLYPTYCGTHILIFSI